MEDPKQLALFCAGCFALVPGDPLVHQEHLFCSQDCINRLHPDFPKPFPSTCEDQSVDVGEVAEMLHKRKRPIEKSPRMT